MYTNLLKTLHLSWDSLIPYKGINLQGSMGQQWDIGLTLN